MGFGAVGGDAQALELVALGGGDAAGPQQQQVRLEAEQALHVQLPLAPHRRQAGQRGGPFAAVEHAHQQVVGLQFEHDFTHRGGKADDPQRLTGLCAAGQPCQQAEQDAHQPN